MIIHIKLFIIKYTASESVVDDDVTMAHHTVGF